MKLTARSGVLLLLILGLATAAGHAQIPIRIGQYLATPEPLPVADGVYGVTLSIRADGGGLLWEQSYPEVPIRDGSIEARFAGPSPALDISGAWLEILVDGQSVSAAARLEAPSDSVISLEHHKLAFWDTPVDPYGGPAQSLDRTAAYLDLTNWRDGPIRVYTGDAAGLIRLRLRIERGQEPIWVVNGSNATLDDDTGYLQIGYDWEQNLVFDDNEIQARNNGVAANLFLQHQGGNIWFQGAPIHESDRRTKRGIRDLQVGLEEVLRLRPISFEWKDRPGPPQPGFIAQEARDVLADLVTEDEEGTLGLAYGSLIPVLVRAIQEQQAEIEELRADLEALSVPVPGG
jgi:hypothetical protein